MDAHRVPGRVRDKLLLARVVIKNRSSCRECGVCSKVLNEDVLLGAVSASYPGLYDVYLVLRQTRYPADDTAHVIRHLSACVDYESSVLEFRETDVCLKRRMLDLARLVCCLDHSVSLFEGLVHIAYAAVVRGRHVVEHISVQRELIYYLALSLVSRKFSVVFVKVVRGTGVVLDSSVVYQRSALCHCLLDRKYGVQRLVFDLDEVTCLYRFFERLSDDGSHTVANVSHLLVEKAPVVRRRFRLALTCRHVGDIRAVVCGYDLDDSRKRLGF